MDFQCYIAMTAAEYSIAEKLPENIAWMACHFSCYGTGLSNFPPALAENSMIIINDILPPSAHDPEEIADQLRHLKESCHFSSILLDFQRERTSKSEIIAKHICRSLDCPVGVCENYADCGNGTIFINMPKPHHALSDILSQWNGYEIWLEAAIETEMAVIRKDNCQLSSTHYIEPDETYLTSTALQNRYKLDVLENHIELTYTRDIHQLKLLLKEAKDAGVMRAIGLYQQLGYDFTI